MKHEYQRIITLLAEDVVDYKAVALFVAKHYPETFLRAVGGKRTPEEIANECISNGESRIECIKKIRAETNRKTRSVEIQTQIASIFLSPLPAILLGLLVCEMCANCSTTDDGGDGVCGCYQVG